MLFTFVYDRKNENHWSLLIIRYSEYKYPIRSFGLLYKKAVKYNPAFNTQRIFKI